MKERIAALSAEVLRRLHRSSPPHPACESFAYSGGGFDEAEVLIGAKTGLFHLANGDLNRLLEGRIYGLTTLRGRWYAAISRRIALGQRLITAQGYLVSFVLDGPHLAGLRVEWCPIDTSVHQIDQWNSGLFITETAHNRILRFPVHNTSLGAPQAFYPSGRLERGRQSVNYAHINSVYSDGSHIYVVYHNDSTNSGRKSQVALLDMDMNVVDTMPIEAECAHNVIRHKGRLHFCDSANGRFRNEEGIVFERPVYLRGLARSNDFWIVGGSDFSTKTDRSLTTGYLYRFSDTGEVQGEMRIPETGSIYEVRLVNEPDLGISQFANHDAFAHSADSVKHAEAGYR